MTTGVKMFQRLLPSMHAQQITLNSCSQSTKHSDNLTSTKHPYRFVRTNNGKIINWCKTHYLFLLLMNKVFIGDFTLLPGNLKHLKYSSFKRHAKNTCNTLIPELRTDRGGDYISTVFEILAYSWD
jgi:hypothetical protein